MTDQDRSPNPLVPREPADILSTGEKSLEERLNKVRLSDQEIAEIIANRTRKDAVRKLLGLFKIGQIASIFLEWNENVTKQIETVKKERLFAEYINKHERVAEAVESLKRFVTNPYGNVLFNKIIQILNDTPPEPELSTHLATVLINMTQSDFESLFDDHKYALSQIQDLTPQALTVLADHRNWPAFELGFDGGVRQIHGGKVASNWTAGFIHKYVEVKAINDAGRKERLQHTVSDLRRKGYMDALTNSVDSNVAKCIPTNIGNTLIRYLT